MLYPARPGTDMECLLQKERVNKPSVAFVSFLFPSYSQRDLCISLPYRPLIALSHSKACTSIPDPHCLFLKPGASNQTCSRSGEFTPLSPSCALKFVSSQVHPCHEHPQRSSRGDSLRDICGIARTTTGFGRSTTLPSHPICLPEVAIDLAFDAHPVVLRIHGSCGRFRLD
jgi:hypothetical protein